jgi:hypothetical protein
MKERREALKKVVGLQWGSDTGHVGLYLDGIEEERKKGGGGGGWTIGIISFREERWTLYL